MIRLFLDIETLPGEESVREEIARDMVPPTTLREEEVEGWKKEELEKRYRRTALSGDFGKILCIGYIKESPAGRDEGLITGDEPEILRQFWEVAKDVDKFIGHNVLDFDLKFIWKRSVVHSLKPSIYVSFARFRSDFVYDLMREWEKWGRDYISLARLARVLGLESSKGQLDGGKVYDYYREGRLKEIYDYCMGDVRLAREIYNRMTFTESK